MEEAAWALFRVAEADREGGLAVVPAPAQVLVDRIG